jgi:hypothetical protein
MILNVSCVKKNYLLLKPYLDKENVPSQTIIKKNQKSPKTSWNSTSKKEIDNKGIRKGHGCSQKWRHIIGKGQLPLEHTLNIIIWSLF